MMNSSCGRMTVDPAILSPVSALLGALIGGGASPCAAIYTQRSQDRLQRVARVAKREAVYADFVMGASNVLLNAYTHDDIALGGEEQRLVGLINRMRLFAPPNVVKGAERGQSHRRNRAETGRRSSATGERGAVRKPRS